MPTKWYTSQVVKIADEGPQTKRFWLDIPETLDFTPGQFITADLPIHEKRNKRWRSYSIANSPSEEGLLELCIVRLDGGLASQYFFEEVEVGTEVTYKGPAGRFVLPEPLDQDLVMICTGTGVAPFRSMLQQIYSQDQPNQRVHLIFGTRKESGILYREEFEDLAKTHLHFEYDITLSREPKWSGLSGYVHQVYLEKYAVPRPDLKFLVCGWSMMVDDAVNKLLELGYPKEQIHFELYG